VTRRQLLLLSGAGAILTPALKASEPQNLSYPLREIQGSLTPPELFFVRDHFNEPQLSLETWQLRIEGRVARPYQLSFSDLLELPAKKVEAVLECSGNAANGAAASNGVWEGVPISYLLEPAGIDREAAFLAFEGVDTGRLFQDSTPLPYAQVVPLEKCLDASSLVAFKLNDLYLPRRNGFPARAVFPGWYAMDSVKWVRRIAVLSAGDRQTAFYQSGMERVYNRVVRTDDGPKITCLSSLQVKSVVAWPSDKTNLPAGRHLVWGFAWTGTGAIREVVLSVDGGKTWMPVQLQSSPAQYSWVRWSYTWSASPGDYVLMSRASDSQGNQQAMQRDKARKDVYELNWCVPLQCSVR
jgi:DMSO/TMAO reductase YedYZ molybdopterin-dependent catalytic subunit